MTKTTKVRTRPGGPVMETTPENAKILIDAGLFVPESEKEEASPEASPSKRKPSK